MGRMEEKGGIMLTRPFLSGFWRSFLVGWGLEKLAGFGGRKLEASCRADVRGRGRLEGGVTRLSMGSGGFWLKIVASGW
jgi:hypothetical protein